MEPNTPRKPIPRQAVTVLRNLYTSLFASIAALIFSNILLSNYWAAYEYNEIEYQSHASKAFLNLLFPVVMIATAALVYNYFDNLDLFNKREYFDGDQKAALISRPQYLVGFAVSVLFATLILTNGYHMALSFFFPTVNVVLARLLSVITMVILRLIQLTSLQDKWNTEIENPLFVEKAVFKRNRDPQKFKVRQIILQPIGYCIVFSLCAGFFGTFGFPLFLVIFNIIISPNLWWTFARIPVILIVVTLTIRLVYNTKRRAILIKKLKQIHRERLASVRIRGSRWLSATLTFLPFTVEVTTNEGEVYNCLVVTSGKINAPMYFKPDEYMVEHGLHMRGGGLLSKGGAFGQVVDITKWGGRENPTNMVFGYRVAHKLKFREGDGKPTVLLNPTPTTAFSVEGREYFTIDTGEDMKNYTIYTATGFFNHIERESHKGLYDD